MSDTKPIQAGPRDPHWVVVSMAKEDGPMHGARPWRNRFRHPTQESAEAECARLAALMPGVRFTVYASGVSHKLEAIAGEDVPQLESVQ